MVSTPMGAAPEIVDEGVTGYLRIDEEGLARALADVAGLDRSACRRAVEARFSMERMAGDHEAVYRGLVEVVRAQEDAELASMLDSSRSIDGEDDAGMCVPA